MGYPENSIKEITEEEKAAGKSKLAKEGHSLFIMEGKIDKQF